ncbi:MAG: hypothetical protein ACYC2P_08775 [Paludibacteraceae bacterium]
MEKVIEEYKAKLKEAINDGYSDRYLESLIESVYEYGKLDGVIETKKLIIDEQK